MAASFDKSIVVGASSGLGAAIAAELASRGARVAIVARRAQELERVASSIRRDRPEADVRVYLHDVTDFDATAPLFERIVHDLGGLDALVYAAGVMPPIVEGEYAFAKDRQMVDVNLLGAMAWMNPAAARFEAARAGTIVGISSVAGERGRRGNPAYGASKAGLTSYLESLRNRLARYGVNVVTIKPGFVDTAMTRGMKGLFWLVSAGDAARKSLALAARGGGPSGFVPRRWALVAWVVRSIPSLVFRKLDL